MKSPNCSWWYMLLVYIRPIIAHRYFGIFGMPIFIYHLIFADKKKYKEKRKSFWGVKSLDELVKWFNANYKYKADPAMGFFDHDNSELEFFTTSGDCDDAGLYTCRSLRKQGHKANRIYMIDTTRGMSSCHVDCVVQINENEFMIFDYARPIYGTSVESCMKQLCNKWYAKNKYDKVQWIVK